MKFRQPVRYLISQIQKQLVFQGFFLLFSPQDPVFFFLQLCGDETFGVDQGLFADEMIGYLIQLGPRYFKIVTKDPVITDLKVLDTGRLPFFGLQ